MDLKKTKRKYGGLGPPIKTATLPDGTETTEFQDWRVSFGRKRTRRRRDIRVIEGVTMEGIVADRSGALPWRSSSSRCGQLFEPTYYYLRYQLPEAPFVIQVELDNIDELSRMVQPSSSTCPRRR